MDLSAFTRIWPAPMTQHIWTLTEARAKLSEIMRRASSEGPQIIGARKSYVLVPKDQWDSLVAKPPALGAWLIDHMPRAAGPDDELQLPDSRDPPRATPFAPDTP